jgi:hypothetical protein
MNESTEFRGSRDARDAHLSIHDQPADTSMAAGAREEFIKLWNERVGNPHIPGRILEAYEGNKKKLLEDLSAIGLIPPGGGVTSWRIRNVDSAKTGGQFVSKAEIEPILTELSQDHSPKNIERLRKKVIRIIIPAEKPAAESTEDVSRTPDGKEYYNLAQLKKAVRDIVDRRKKAYIDDEESLIEFKKIFNLNLIYHPGQLISLARKNKQDVESLAQAKGMESAYKDAIDGLDNSRISIEEELDKIQEENGLNNSPRGVLHIETAAATAMKSVLDAKRLIKELEDESEGEEKGNPNAETRGEQKEKDPKEYAKELLGRIEEWQRLYGAGCLLRYGTRPYHNILPTSGARTEIGLRNVVLDHEPYFESGLVADHDGSLNNLLKAIEEGLDQIELELPQLTEKDMSFTVEHMRSVGAKTKNIQQRLKQNYGEAGRRRAEELSRHSATRGQERKWAEEEIEEWKNRATEIVERMNALQESFPTQYDSFDGEGEVAFSWRIKTALIFLSEGRVEAFLGACTAWKPSGKETLARAEEEKTPEAMHALLDAIEADIELRENKIKRDEKGTDSGESATEASNEVTVEEQKRLEKILDDINNILETTTPDILSKATDLAGFSLQKSYENLSSKTLQEILEQLNRGEDELATLAEALEGLEQMVVDFKEKIKEAESLVDEKDDLNSPDRGEGDHEGVPLSPEDKATGVNKPQEKTPAQQGGPRMKMNLLRKDHTDTTLTTDAERFLYEVRTGKKDLPPELTDDLKNLLLTNDFEIKPEEWDEITPEIALDMLEGAKLEKRGSPDREFWRKIMRAPGQAVESTAEKLEKIETYLNKRSLELGLKWKNLSKKKKILYGLGAGVLAAGAGAGAGVAFGAVAGASVAGIGRLGWRFISAGLTGLGTYAGLEAASWEREQLGQEQRWFHSERGKTAAGAMATALVLAIGTAASEGIDAIMDTDAAERATQAIGEQWNALWQKFVEVKLDSVANSAGEAGVSISELSTEEIESEARDFIRELDKRGSELDEKLNDALSSPPETTTPDAPDATTDTPTTEASPPDTSTEARDGTATSPDTLPDTTPVTPPETTTNGSNTSPDAETIETPSAESQSITLEAGGSVWKAAFELGERAELSHSEIYEMLGNSTHLVDGKEVPLLELDRVHTGDSLAISGDPEPHFEFVDKAGDGLEAGTDLPGEVKAETSPSADEGTGAESVHPTAGGDEVYVEGESTVDLSAGDATEQELSPETAQQAVPTQEITPQFLETQVRDMLRGDLERIYDDHYHWVIGETDPWNDIKGFEARDVIRGDLGDKWELRQLFAGKYGSDHRELRDYMRSLMDKTNLVPEKNEKVQNFIIRMADKIISNKYSR